VPALKTLAKLQEEAKLQKDAAQTYEELANVPGLPKDVKQQAGSWSARLLLRGGEYGEAQTRLEKLAGSLSDGEAQKPFVQAYLAEAKIAQNKTDGVESQLEGIITGSNDPKLRAVAYNLLGDLHRNANRNDDAFWAHLRVDVLYHEDADEQAKALVLPLDAVRQDLQARPGRAAASANAASATFVMRARRGRSGCRRTRPAKDEPKEVKKDKDKDVTKDKDKK